MDATLFQWLKNNEGRTFSSPRKEIFGRKPKNFTITSIDEHKKAVRVKFEGSKYQAPPLYFTMFDRVLEYLRNNPKTIYPIGARLQPPYSKESIEGEIWREPKPYSTEYKSAPHVLDILVHAGLAKYAYTTSRDSGNKVQGAQYNSEQTPPTRPDPPSVETEKKANQKPPKETIRAREESVEEAHHEEEEIGPVEELIPEIPEEKKKPWWKFW